MNLMPMLDPTNYTQSVFALPIGAVAVLAVTVGVWVVWHERARPVSVSFLTATLAMAVYLFGFSGMVRSASHDVALYWGKIAYAGVPFIVPALYQFSMDLLGIRERRTWMIRIAWAVAGVYMILAVGTDVLVAGVFRMEWGYITRLTPWNYGILAWSGFLTFLALRDYHRAYGQADEIQRARIRLFAIPLLIAALGFIDYTPSMGFPTAPWGFVVFALFLLAAARAVSRYHLPDLTPAFAADQIINTMNEPLLVCDERDHVAIANPAAVRLFGWTIPEIEGRPLGEVLGTANAELVLRSGRNGTPVELDVPDRAGSPVEVSVSTTELLDRDGRKVGTIVVARDVRERRRAAQEIERREQRFRALTENALDTITILDGGGRITYVSPAVRELLGYGSDELLGRRIREFMHPDSEDGVEHLFDDLLDSGGRRVDGESRLRDADGRYRTFEFRATSLLDHPAVRGVVINGRDVTEERRLSGELQQAQKMEAIGRLAGGVAHDFNNILTAIQGNVALVLEQADPASRFAAELDEIRRGADRAGRLTDQLLSFSRRQVVQPRLLDLNEVVCDIREMLGRLIGETIELRTDLEDDGCPVHADRGQLEQVLVNLVVNARDAVNGSGRIDLRTALETVSEPRARESDAQVQPGRYAVLEVTDNGHGMDQETRTRIFEPFFTTKDAGRGTGLGLSTVYGSVRQAGGYIEVASEEGMGTTFRIFLPAVEGPAAATGVAVRSGGRDAQAAVGGESVRGCLPQTTEPDGPVAPGKARSRPAAPEGGVVLVVEDEAPVRTLMARVLERRRYRVLTAEDGAAALRVAREFDGVIDLVVTDLVMPGLNGREVAEAIRENRPGTPVIFISGYTADDVIRQGIVAGDHEFLPKPFTPDVLLARVAAALGRNPAARSAPAGTRKASGQKTARA